MASDDIKNKFKTGDKPTEQDFADLIDYAGANPPQPTNFYSKEQTYDKNEIDSRLNQIESQTGTGKVKVASADTVGYLGDKLDGVTLQVDDGKIVAESINGLSPSANDINNWLVGTSDNIQDQFNAITNSLSNLVGGMKWIGNYDTKADLLAVESPQNGNSAIVDVDESNNGERVWYVYSGDNSEWQVMTVINTSAEKFTDLADTPNSLDNADKKALYVDSVNNKIAFGEIEWKNIGKKPHSTTVEIDSAVTKAHTHDNKTKLDRLSVNQDNELTIDGVVYRPKKGIITLGYTSSYKNQGANSLCIFDYNTNNNADPLFKVEDNKKIELNPNKMYLVTFTARLILGKWVNIGIGDYTDAFGEFTLRTPWITPFAVQVSNAANSGSTITTVVDGADGNIGIGFGAKDLNVEIRAGSGATIVEL